MARQKRKFSDTNSLDNIMAAADQKIEEQHKNEPIVKEKPKQLLHAENTSLSCVNLSYFNKRVVTQLIRFIPDSLTDIIENEEITGDKINSFILKQLKEIPVNNIVREYRKRDIAIEEGATLTGDFKEMDKYVRHDDIYDPDLQGIFIGKGICFHNIATENKAIIDVVNSFVDAVHTSGQSVKESGDVVEKPSIYKVGGQQYRLVFGHQRYCYLIYAFGREYIYNFILASNTEKQNQKIYLENNTKRSETGYEKLVSLRDTYTELNLKKQSTPWVALSVGRATFFKIKRFMENPECIDVIKKKAFNLSYHQAHQIMDEVYKGLTIIHGKTLSSAMVLEAFSTKLDEIGKKVIKESELTEKTKIKVSIPQEKSAIEKLLFEDVRKWSTIDVTQYDLTKKSDLTKYFRKLVDELGQ
ncbi:MAG: hypothetical protein ACSHW0_18450 [Thalassotalea sp.]